MKEVPCSICGTVRPLHQNAREDGFVCSQLCRLIRSGELPADAADRLPSTPCAACGKPVQMNRNFEQPRYCDEKCNRKASYNRSRGRAENAPSLLQPNDQERLRKAVSFWLPPHGIGTCAWCGDWFGRKQPDQRTCSTKCGRRLQYQVAAKYRSEYRRCTVCNGEFSTTMKRRKFCGKVTCKSRGREQPPQTNDWFLANKPQLPTEPCLNCNAPVVQYRQRRKDGDMRYCSTACRPGPDPIAMLAGKASWPPTVTTGAKMTIQQGWAMRQGCLDCGTQLKLGRCGTHAKMRRNLVHQLRTRINWLLPRVCVNCNGQFSRFDQGGVCNECLKASNAENHARRKARIRGAMRSDRGISHRALHKMFNGICGLCNNETQRPEVWNGWDGKTWMPLAPTVDHIIPLARAGTHTWDNVQLAHWSCNSLKSAS